MKEEQIRPAHMLAECTRLGQQDREYILRRSSEFVSVPCPACDRNTCSPEFQKDGFSFVRCPACRTLFISPRPTLQMVMDYDAQSKASAYWSEHVLPASESYRLENIFRPRAKLVAELCREHGSDDSLLLDVGAGPGTFCLAMKETGFFKHVTAIEPSARLADSCRRNGVHVIQEPIENAEVRSASVIASFELIEHLFSPREFLVTCRAALSENGLLILTTPNVFGFDLLILGERSGNVCGPQHLNYFHPASLRTLLEGCGFAVVKTLTPGRLDAEIVRSQILRGSFNVDSQPFLKEILIERWDELAAKLQTFLAENGLSSHLWVVAKRCG